METEDSIFIRACMRRHTPRRPVWFMRQAGRYLPKYNELKGGRNILDVQKDPEISSAITLLPVKELGVDAAIIYSDIMVPVSASGFGVRIEESIGPVAERTISSHSDIKGFRDFDCARDAPYVLESIRLSKSNLSKGIPLIGFSAAPFTLLSYLFEGKPSRTFERCRFFMENRRDEWERCMDLATGMVSSYLLAQIDAGVDAIQLFDSWAGLLPERMYKEMVLPYTAAVFESIRKDIPKIHFSANTLGRAALFASTGCNVLSLDPETSMKKVFNELGGSVAIQGNLSPAIARDGGKAMEDKVDSILREMDGIDGFVFNLGHGVLKETDPNNLKAIVGRVKSAGNGTS